MIQFDDQILERLNHPQILLKESAPQRRLNGETNCNPSKDPLGRLFVSPTCWPQKINLFTIGKYYKISPLDRIRGGVVSETPMAKWDFWNLT